MNVLITGGAGFVGSNLAKSLLKDGHNITIVDNLVTSNLTNIGDILQDVEFFELDLSQPVCIKTIDSILEGIDVVYHLAASIGVKLIQEQPKSSLHNSMNINNNLFGLFEKHQVKVIFSSTSEVYGETKNFDGSKETDHLEIHPPHKPRGSYACSKLMSEFLIRSYSFPNTIIRFFNVVGKDQLPDYGHVLPRFIRSIKNNEDIIIYGDGEQVRSFCDIRDAVNMLKLLVNDEHNDEIYNIGNDGNGCTMNELAYLCKEVFGSNVDKTYMTFNEAFGPQFDEIYVRFPNTDKIKKYYQCQYDLESIIEGLK